MPDRFGFSTYLVRKQVLKLFGEAFHIYGPNNELVFYSKMKAFKLREDIRLFTNEDMREELLRISARQIIDFGATYDVVDSPSNTKIGALRRKGIKSIFKDEWVFLDAQDQEMGLIQEDGVLLALVRRYVPMMNVLLPQVYHGTISTTPVCTFRRHFNPLVQKITLDFSMDVARALDRRLGLAAAVLLGAIEGRQE